MTSPIRVSVLIAILLTIGGSAAPRRADDVAGQQRMPAWPPNGGWIAVVSHPRLSDQPEIYLMRRDGSEMTLMTRNPAWGGGLNPKFIPGTL